MKTTLFIYVLAGAFLTDLANSSAGTVYVDGDITSLDAVGAAVVGTFKPGFNPYSYKYVYGIDPVGNMSGPNYNRAVSDGNFRPAGSGDGWVYGGGFYALGDTTGMDGQQVWLFLFNNETPDLATQFVLCSGSGSSWIAPSGALETTIAGDSADQFVFGNGGRGSALMFQGMPIPEPSAAVLLLAGAMCWAGRRSRDCRVLI
jgi:hypothetical protein